MRTLLIAILVLLSACASFPDASDLSKRKASWQGAPVDELVAVLGQPGLRSEQGAWAWQFWASPERRDSYIRSTESSSGPSGCGNCAPSSLTGSPAAGAPAYSFLVGRGSTPKSEGGPKPVCTYLVDVENGTIVKLRTLGVPGAFCRFEELTLRPNQNE